MTEGNNNELINEPRKYDFQSLSERITVQTEAYIGFSNALVKIIEQVANNRDISIQIKESLNEEYKELNDGFRNILLEITKYHSDEVNNHNLLNKESEIIKSKLSQIDTKIDLVIKENKIYHDDIDEKNIDIYNYSKDIIKKIDDFKEENKLNNESIIKFINAQDENLKIIQETYKKIKYIIWAIGALLAVYTLLSNFHILNLTWFTNSSK